MSLIMINSIKHGNILTKMIVKHYYDCRSTSYWTNTNKGTTCDVFVIKFKYRNRQPQIMNTECSKKSSSICYRKNSIKQITTNIEDEDDDYDCDNCEL